MGDYMCVNMNDVPFPANSERYVSLRQCLYVEDAQNVWGVEEGKTPSDCVH